MMPIQYANGKSSLSQASESDGASTGEGAQSLTELTDTESPCRPVIVPKEHASLWQCIESHQKYAYREADIYLVFIYVELAGAANISDATVKLLLDAIKLMHQCDIEVPDICSVLAHASSYFPSIHAKCGSKMDQNEMGYILAALVYLAHTYVIDENCPLKYWHQRLFRKYSALKVLDAAIMRLLKMLDYRLRVDEEDLGFRYERILQAVHEGVVSGPGLCYGTIFHV